MPSQRPSVSSLEPEPHLQQASKRAGLPEWRWVRHFNGLRWVDGRNGMLVDDLCAITSHKLDREVVERSDLALEPDSICEEDRDFYSVIAKVFQEHVLKN